MSTETALLLIIIGLLFVALPSWPYSKSWGYVPTSVLTILLVVFLAWAIIGQRPLFRRTVGDDIRAAGRDVSESIRRTVE